MHVHIQITWGGEGLEVHTSQSWGLLRLKDLDLQMSVMFFGTFSQ